MNTNDKTNNALQTVFSANKRNTHTIYTMRPESNSAPATSRSLLTIDVAITDYRRLKMAAARERKHLGDLVIPELESFDKALSNMDDEEAKATVMRRLEENATTKRTSVMAPDELISSLREKAASYLIPLKAILQAALAKEL